MRLFQLIMKLVQESKVSVELKLFLWSLSWLLSMWQWPSGPMKSRRIWRLRDHEGQPPPQGYQSRKMAWGWALGLQEHGWGRWHHYQLALKPGKESFLPTQTTSSSTPAVTKATWPGRAASPQGPLLSFPPGSQQRSKGGEASFADYKIVGK